MARHLVISNPLVPCYSINGRVRLEKIVTSISVKWHEHALIERADMCVRVGLELIGMEGGGRMYVLLVVND